MATERQDYSVEALLSFLDWAATKGKMNQRTAEGRKVACNRLFSVLDEDERADVRTLDLDDIAARFHNLQGTSYTQSSLREYRRRVEKAITDFLEWKKDPSSWRPSTASPKTRDKGERSETLRSEKPRGTGSSVQPRSIPPSWSPTEQPVYPYPLRPEVTVLISNLPRDLTLAEARRLGAFLQTLAVDYSPNA